MRIRFPIVFLALLTAVLQAQDSPDKSAPDKPASDHPASSHAAPEQTASDKAAAQNRDTEASSSRDTRIDISPPNNDEKSHPDSQAAVAGLGPESADNPDTSGIQEFHPWNPMKALKDIEVGNYYFKLKNYKAALDRYKEALYYKDGDAVASFRLAVCQEKLGDKAEARKYYEQYLKVLPDGPFAKDAHASLDRMAKAQ